MLFNTLSYALFFPLVFIIYWICWRILTRSKNQVFYQNIFLLVASYVFYAWWDWRFLGLLIGMSVVSWITGEIIRCANKTVAKMMLVVTIVLDIIILGFFKYYNFFVINFANLLGIHDSIQSLSIVLPLGISFFTFQAISYIVDMYNGKLLSLHGGTPHLFHVNSLVECLLYIGFFPKLLAGPIERSMDLIQQIRKKRDFCYDLAVDGVRQILWGLFKKVVVADNCAVYVNQVYGDYANQTGSTLLLAAILYTLQIYGDFSGYSDMAIGSAKLLGFKLRDNFIFPYFSRNMNEFWRRWHISLNMWFVNYIYIPLGGSYGSKAMTIRNTMIIFLLSGLWHGADWSFMVWGAYHGVLLILLILLNRNEKYKHIVAYERGLPTIKEVGQISLVFSLVTIGWMIFRADNMAQFIDYLKHMFDVSLLTIPKLDGSRVLFLNIAIMFAMEWRMRREKHGLDISKVRSAVVRYAIYYAVFFAILIFGGNTENFIYMYF